MITMPEEKNNEEKNKALKTIVKGGGIVFIGLIFARVAGYFYRVVVARFLGSSIYGMYSLGLAVFSILVAVSLLGVNSGIRRFIPYYKGKDQDRTRGILRSGIKISMPLSFVFSFVLVVFAPQLSVYLFNNSSMSMVLRVFGALIPIKVFVDNLRSVVVGLKKVKYDVYSFKFLNRGLKFLLTVVFIFLGYELFGILIALFIGITIALMALLYFLVFKLDYFSFPKSDFSVKKLFFYSLPLVIATIFMKIIGWTDVLMMGYFLPASEVGIYNAALPTAMVLPFFLSSINRIIFPVFSELYGKENLLDLRRTYQVTSKWILAFTLPFFLVMFLFPRQLLLVMFGSEYLPAALSLSILAVAYFYHAAMGSVGSLLKTIGETKLFAWVTGISAAVNIVLNFVLIPIYGIVGGAIATGVAVVIYNSLWLFFIYRKIRVHPFTFSYLKTTLAGLLSVLFVFFSLDLLFKSPSIFIYVLGFFIFLVLYALFSLLIGVIEPEDLMILRATERKVGLDLNFVKKIVRKFS